MYKLCGEDKHMYNSWSKNYFSQCVIFETPIPNMDELIHSRFERALTSSSSIGRVKPLKKIPSVYYTTQRTKHLTKKLIHRVDNIDFNDIELHTKAHFMPFVIFYNNVSICGCFNHSIFDGVAAYNLFQCVFDTDHTFHPPSFMYVPLISEIALVPQVLRFMEERRAFLKYDIDVTHRKSLHFKHDLAKYKGIKRSSPNKVAFPSVVIAEMLQKIFQTVTTDSLSICVLGAIEGDGSFFNNYGVVFCNMRRPKPHETSHNYLSYVHSTLDERKNMVALSYIALNTHEYRPKVTGQSVIDVMFSGMPMTTATKPITMNDVRVQSVKSHMTYTSFPLYCGFLSCDRYVHFYTNTRSSDIDQSKLERLLTGHTPPESS